MQLLGSIITAIAVIAVVTSQLGPFKEDTERQEQIQEQQEEQREQQEEQREDSQDRRDDDGDNAGSGG